MSVFIVVSHAAEPALAKDIEGKFGKNQYAFTSNAWFVNYPKTARDLAEELNIKKGGLSGAVVVQCAPTFWGMSTQVLWSWLQSAFENPEDV